MAYTYAGNPAGSLVDATHFYLGNTNPASPIATDEECAFALANNRNHPMLAAAALAETKALTFVNRPSTVKRGDRTTSYADQAEGFLMLARTLRMQASIATTTVYAGGLDPAEKEAEAQDRGLVQPWARVHLHELSPHPRRMRDEERDPL